MSLPLEEYALIGDTHTAALVSRGGSIDWLCLPRFDSDACFAALLGDEQHGRWLVAPRDDYTTTRSYDGDTLVLRSEHRTATGAVRVTDFMTPRRSQARVVRAIEGIAGSVPMQSDLGLRFDFGRAVPWLRPRATWVSAVAGPDAVDIQADVPLEVTTGSVASTFTVRPGDRVAFVLTWHRSHEPAPPRIQPWAALRATMRYWERWVQRCTYRGEWRSAVLRSLLTLKALTYRPTGGIVAAPTTSIPEEIGGVRNWDYRFCWLRDATFTLYSLLMAGYVDEAEAWREWLLRAIAGDPRDLRIMYGLAGERRLSESTIDWLPGYEGSGPVRTGNAASEQFQLDVYGEVLDLLHSATREGLPHESSAWEIELRILDVLESTWREPDEGIWEVRGGRRQFVHSKLMAWVGVDRAIRDVEVYGFSGPVERWRALRAEIHDEVCAYGFDDRVSAFTQAYGERSLDAAVLMMPLVGFLPIEDARVASTIDAVEDRLLHGGFLHRYDNDFGIDGLPGSEGAFLPCTCWLADCRQLQGRSEEARALFQRVLDIRNDVGLLSEEYDVSRGRLVGNYPQAFSHVSLIGTARNLSRGIEGPARRRMTLRRGDRAGARGGRRA